MKYLALTVIVLAVCIGCTDARPPASMDGRKAAQAEPTMARQSGPSNGGPQLAATAQKVHIDPQTGEFVPPPQAESPPESQPLSPAALTSSVETIQEEPSPVPGGGMMIDLRGRHQSPITATIDSNGRTTVEHNSDAPGE